MSDAPGVSAVLPGGGGVVHGAAAGHEGSDRLPAVDHPHDGHGGAGEPGLRPPGCDVAGLSALRQSADAGEHPVRPGGRLYVGGGGAVVLLPQRGDDLRQVHLSLWPGDPGAVAGVEHDAAVRAPVQAAVPGGGPGPALHGPRHRQRFAAPTDKERAEGVLHHGDVEPGERHRHGGQYA